VLDQEAMEAATYPHEFPGGDVHGIGAQDQVPEGDGEEIVQTD